MGDKYESKVAVDGAVTGSKSPVGSPRGGQGGRHAPTGAWAKHAQHSEETNVDVSSLNCPEWLKSALQKLDTDGDGLEQEEIEDMLDYMAKQKDARKTDAVELDYTR